MRSGSVAGLCPSRARSHRSRLGWHGPTQRFPSIESLIQRYAGRSGLDVSQLSWYTALGYYKLAVICEGIYYRFVAGQTVGPGFDQIGDIVAPLVSAGREVLT